MFAESRFSIYAVANLCQASIQNFSHMAHLLHLCDMPSCPIVSSDLRAHIPILCHVYGYSIQKICCVLGVGKTLVYKTLKVHWTLDGPHSLVLAGKKTGRRRTLTPADISFIKGLLIHKHTMYIDEIQWHLFLHHGVSVSITTIFRTLHRLDFSNKAISAQALE